MSAVHSVLEPAYSIISTCPPTHFPSAPRFLQRFVRALLSCELFQAFLVTIGMFAYCFLSQISLTLQGRLKGGSSSSANLYCPREYFHLKLSKFQNKLGIFKIELDIFHVKLNTHLSKLNSLEINVLIFEIEKAG